MMLCTTSVGGTMKQLKQAGNMHASWKKHKKELIERFLPCRDQTDEGMTECLSILDNKVHKQGTTAWLTNYSAQTRTKL